MKKILLLAIAFFVSIFSACKKEIVPVEPNIPAVVLDGGFWQLNGQNLMEYVMPASKGTAVLAYPNTDEKETSAVQTMRAVHDAAGEEAHDYVHVVFAGNAGAADDNGLWVREENIAFPASTVVLVDEMPFVPESQGNSPQFDNAQEKIPANTIIALHRTEMWLDFLKVSWLSPEDNSAEHPVSRIRTGFIPNPHPFFSEGQGDVSAIRLLEKSGETEDKEEKKTLLNEALALDLSPKVRASLEAALKELEPPPQPMVSYERIHIPSLLKLSTKSRYGVNMSELLKGGTEDPWAKDSQ